MKSDTRTHTKRIEKLKLENATLRKRNAELESLEIEHGRMEGMLVQQANELRERIKEINCLYGISKIVENTENTLDTIYQKVVELIPASWQYPDITCAQLTIGGRKFQTKNYHPSKWCQAVDIIAYKKIIGSLDVCYLEERPDRDEGPFLMEERFLISAIAERLGRTTERKEAQRALFESEQKLKRQNQLLQEKNIALREVMNQVLVEKKHMEERVLHNVDQLLLPLIEKLKQKGSNIEGEYIQLLEDNLKQLFSGFGSEISRKLPKLTPRETEICNMIRNGLSSKEIARLLNISYRSVETYRNYIRKKLGITNKKVNLAIYLAKY